MTNDKKKVRAAEASTKGGGNPSTREQNTQGKGSGAVKGGKRLRDARSDNPPTATKKGIRGVPGSKNDSRRCKAKANRTGERCKRAAIKGGTVCTTHGGRAPQVVKSARERLLALVDPAFAVLLKILTDPNADDSVKVRAAIATLDRTGYGANQTVTLEVSEFNAATDAMLSGMIDANGTLPVSRDMSSLPHDGGGERPTVNIQKDSDFDWPDVIDGEVIEDESTDNRDRDRDQFTEPSIPVSERTGPAKSSPYAASNGRHPIWGDDGVRPSSGASEYDPTPSGPYEPGPPTYEERLARDLQDGLPPRNQRRQR